MEIRFNIHTKKDNFLLYIDGQEKQVSYDPTRKTHYVYADVEDTNNFEVIMKNKPKKPMGILACIGSIICLFWFYIILEIGGFGKDGHNWKDGISLFSYEAKFHIRNLKDQEVNIRYSGNRYQKGIWLKPQFTIADEAHLTLTYQMNLAMLQYGYQKYWMFFGSLNVCFVILASFLIYVIAMQMIPTLASIVILSCLGVLLFVFISNDYHIYKDYCYHRSLVQVDGASPQVYEETFN